MNIQTFETWLPVFPGFYHTLFDESDSFIECELSDEGHFRECYPELADVPFDFIRANFWDAVDYARGNLAVVNACRDALPDLFPAGMVTECKLQCVVSPREYNFANDSANVEITVDADALRRYLIVYAADFREYLRQNYTGRDGFIPHYSNDADDWRRETERFSKLDGHYLGALLQFVAFNEDPEAEMALYWAANVSETFHCHAEVNTQRVLDQWECEAKAA